MYQEISKTEGKDNEERILRSRKEEEKEGKQQDEEEDAEEGK